MGLTRRGVGCALGRVPRLVAGLEFKGLAGARRPSQPRRSRVFEMSSMDILRDQVGCSMSMAGGFVVWALMVTGSAFLAGDRLAKTVTAMDAFAPEMDNETDEAVQPFNVQREREQHSEQYAKKYVDAVGYTPPGSSAGVWEEVWGAVGRGEGDVGMTSTSVAWASDERGRTWVGAVDSRRVVGLMRVCLEELEREVGGVDAREAESDIDGLLVAVARRVASRWLGYVPGMLGEDEVAREGTGERTGERRVQLVRVGAGSARGGLYGRVLRLLDGERERERERERGRERERERGGTGKGRSHPVSWVAQKTQGLGLHQKDSDVGQWECVYRIAPAVLQDMAMTVADHVCGAYIQDISERSSLWPAFLDQGLVSTRDIQGFVNRLYLRRLVDEYVWEIVDVYEDRLPVFRFEANRAGTTAILGIRKSSVRMRRGSELAALRGVRYVVSLMVEALDVARPMVGVCRRWLAEAVSWVLREVVGRGIGFVWEGMRCVLDTNGSNSRRGERGGHDSTNDDGGKVTTSRQGEDFDVWPGAGVFV